MITNMLANNSLKDAAPDIVPTESGLLSGMAGTVPGVRVFKGIPYAAAPVGHLRWKAPQPPASWEGVRSASQFGSNASQFIIPARAPFTEEFMPQGSVSEDCLFLNIWTPAAASAGRLPVLVFIHGGGFCQGSGAIRVLDGEALAGKGIIVVTINYRLGLFGFLAHPELTAASGRGSSGNYGLLDQVAALQWVNRNIAAFGGDPGNVTIAGQSAGAMSVHFLLASPLAKGLFHRAVIESGSGINSFTGLRSLETAEQEGLLFAGVKGAGTIDALRNMPVDQLQAVVAGMPFRFDPVIDGWFLPANVPEIFSRGGQHDVPTLTGLNADEGSLSASYGKCNLAALRGELYEQYKDDAGLLLRLYNAASDKDAGPAQQQMMRDKRLVSMFLWARQRSLTSATDVYTYHFDRAMPGPSQAQFGAFHTSEIPYVFNNLRLLSRPWKPLDGQLAGIMSAYWINFAANGDPNGKGLPAWPAFDSAAGTVMNLGMDLGPRAIATAEKFSFFERRLLQAAEV